MNGEHQFTHDEIESLRLAWIEAAERQSRRCVLQELATIGAATLAVLIVIAAVVGAWLLIRGTW